MRLVDTTKPTSLPISIGEAREQCRVTDDTHDTLLMRLIEDVTEQVETINEMRLITRTVRLDMDGFPSGGADIEIPVYPVSAVSSVAYTDGDGAAQTLTLDTGGSPEGDYWESLDGPCPFLRPLSLWPTYKLYKPASVQITMSVGYANQQSIPSDLKNGMLLRIKELFDVSGESVTGVSMQQAINTFDSHIKPYRKYRA